MAKKPKPQTPDILKLKADDFRAMTIAAIPEALKANILGEIRKAATDGQTFITIPRQLLLGQTSMSTVSSWLESIGFIIHRWDAGVDVDWGQCK